MSNVTNFRDQLIAWRGQATTALNLALSYNMGQLQELIRAARAANVDLVLPAITPAVAATQSVVQIAHAADVTNYIEIRDAIAGVPSATGLATIAIAVNGSDNLAATMSAGGALVISLANTTNSKNTLTLIKAAIDAVCGAVGKAAISTKIVGTATTQMDGTTAAETYVAAAPGAAAGTGVKSSVAGTAVVAASRTLAVTTR
jgi:ABC-type uncharacterized transport system ATPase subunit